MAKSTSKVQKKIFKKKGSKANSLHENSRDFKKLRRAASRDEKLEARGKQRNVTREIIVDRILWFAERAATLEAPATFATAQATIEVFIAEKTKEAVTSAAQRRPNRPKSVEQSRLEERAENDAREYKSGFWIPDMTSEQGWKALKDWYDGLSDDQVVEWASLDRLKYVRIRADGDIQKSRFPPGGDS